MSVLVLSSGGALTDALVRRLGPVPLADPLAALTVAPPVPETAYLVVEGEPCDAADAGRQAWTTVGLLARWRNEDGRLPRRFAILDAGGDGDLVATRSAMIATLVRYLAGALFHDGIAVNCVRPDDRDAEPAAIDALVALGSGLLDAVRGQVLTVGGPT
jgi:hypothetical protein